MFIGEPTHVELTEAEYLSAVDGTLFEWGDVSGLDRSSVASGTAAQRNTRMGNSPLVILNKSTSTINQNYEGYYVGLIGNSDINPANNFVGIRSTATITASAYKQNSYTILPDNTLDFPLSANATTGPDGSLSQLMENLVDYDLEGRDSDDVLSMGVFKLRRTQNAAQAFQLGYNLEDKLVGSVNAFRKIDDQKGGRQLNYFIGNQDANSRNVKVLVNENITQRNSGDDNLDDNSEPKLKVRVVSEALDSAEADANGFSNILGIPPGELPGITSELGYAGKLFPLGAYSNTKVTNKDLGDIPTKLDRALDGIKNDEIYDIDVIPEAGLGTIMGDG